MCLSFRNARGKRGIFIKSDEDTIAANEMISNGLSPICMVAGNQCVCVCVCACVCVFVWRSVRRTIDDECLFCVPYNMEFVLYLVKTTVPKTVRKRSSMSLLIVNERTVYKLIGPRFPRRRASCSTVDMPNWL